MLRSSVCSNGITRVLHRPLCFQDAKNNLSSDSRMRQMRGLFLPHEKTGRASEEPAQHRQGVQLRRVRQNVQEPDEHSPPQVDPHRLEEVRLRLVRLQIEPEVESRESSSEAHQRLLVQMRPVPEGILPEDGVRGARERAHEKGDVSLRPLHQNLSVQEEPDPSREDPSRRYFAGRDGERRETETRVLDLPRGFHPETILGNPFEPVARIARESGSSVRSLRRHALLHQKVDGAQAAPRQREGGQVRRVRQTVREQGEPECSSAGAHGGKTVRLFPVWEEIRAEDFFDLAS